MTVKIKKLRELYEARVGPRDNPNPRGRTGFVRELRFMLGLSDKNGNDYKDRKGNRILAESSKRMCDAEEFSCQELAIATCGYDVYQDFFNPENRAGLHQLRGQNTLLESQFPGDGQALLEAAGIGIGVSAFADINAWTAATGGLIERKILEAFENPDYIGNELMDTESTKIADGQKIIGVSRLGPKAQERQPGEAHARAGLVERWVQLGRTRENALAVDVYKEAAWFDLTGQLLQHAEQHGDWIAWQKEIDQLSAYIGVTTQIGGRWQFQYKSSTTGTAQPYQTFWQAQNITPTNPYGFQLQPNGIPLGYISQLAANDLVDWTSLQNAWLVTQRQMDPETGTRVMVKMDTVTVNPARLATAKLIFDAFETERRTAPSATQATTGDLHVLRARGNVVDAFGQFKVLWSPILEQLHTNPANDPAMPGLGLSQANANQYWQMVAKGKAFKYMQNWPLTVVQAPPTNYDMLDRGIVLSVFGDERGMPAVVSPWHVLQNTN
jgi:hypothetical protein